MYQFLREELTRRFDGQKLKILSLTRDPIARNLSAFFENLEFKKIDGKTEFEVKSDYYNKFEIIPEETNKELVNSLRTASHLIDRLRNDMYHNFQTLNNNFNSVIWVIVDFLWG